MRQQEEIRTEPAGMIEAENFAAGFREAARRYGERVALRTLDDAVSLTFDELRERVDALAGGLASLGLRRGQTIALMLSNRPEFHLVDLAAVTLGAVPFSIYQTLAPEQIAYVVGDADARVAVVEQAYLERFLEARRELPGVEHVLVVDGDAPEGTRTLSEVEAADSDFDAEASVATIAKEDFLTLIYTSGTTGPPKGVQLSHHNLMRVVHGLNAVTQLPPCGRVVSWLPTAHIAERAFHYYLPILLGSTITTCPNPREIIAVLPGVRPDFFFAVPRIWEKVKAGLEAQLESLPEEQRGGVREALEAAVEKVRLEQAGEPVPEELARKVAEADAAVFGAIRGMLGLDQLKVAGVGAAPTPREVLEFFHAIGIPVGEGWGMSETCGVGTVNPPERIKLGTVGVAMPGVELRIAEDGEIMIRGDNVMVGYRNQPEKTAETIDAEGWLATGDVGEIDEDGYLKIVDRKKELIINAAGKNMSPANIEGTLKAASPLIGQICVIGDDRAYNTALIVLDPDYAAAWAKQHGVEGASIETLAADPGVRAALQAGVDAGNARLSRVEQIKKFTIIAGDWSPGGEELTPTMKLKRKPIAAKYAAEIEAMYA